MGLRIQCARCHHHPFERWGQDDYYGFASLFARIGRKPGPDPVTPRIFVLPEGEATDPAGRSYPPRLLGEPGPLPTNGDPREALAEWLRKPDNPFFTRAVVNRYWKHFFGRGTGRARGRPPREQPADAPGIARRPGLRFVSHGFDLKWLVRTLATSRAYELSSEPNAWNALDRRVFAGSHPAACRPRSCLMRSTR